MCDFATTGGISLCAVKGPQPYTVNFLDLSIWDNKLEYVAGRQQLFFSKLHIKDLSWLRSWQNYRVSSAISDRNITLLCVPE